MRRHQGSTVSQINIKDFDPQGKQVAEAWKKFYATRAGGVNGNKNTQSQLKTTYLASPEAEISLKSSPAQGPSNLSIEVESEKLWAFGAWWKFK